MLAGLDREQLRQLVIRMVEGRPDLYDPVAGAVAVVRARAEAPVGPDTRQTSAVDRTAVRRRVRGILHGTDGLRTSEAYWVIGALVEGAGEVLSEARALLEAGDGRDALSVLEAITDEYVREWTMLDDSNGELSGFFPDLAVVWTEALLSVELTPEERTDWEEMLAAWDDDVADYFDPVFGAARAAAREGWDDVELLRVPRGEADGPDAEEPEQEDGDDPDGYFDELIEARLNVLERQGRLVEALRLAEAGGSTLRALLLLVRLGRTADAVEQGLRLLAAPGDALCLARELRDHNAVADALRIGEHGLELEPVGEWNPGSRKAELAIWVRDRAAGEGRADLALRAARVAVRSAPDLAGYLRLRELAGDAWPELREETLHYAVEWLRRARTAYVAAGRQTEWSEYLEGLIVAHQRKYKLRPMLEALRKG